MQTPSHKEKRIRQITQLYYSRKDVQDAIFNFSKNREISPSFMMESFGKRPDSLQYSGDIIAMVKKGATSFHCSEELWNDVMKLSTGLNENQLNELRMGWDLLLDIDSKYIDYSKISAELIINLLKFHGVKNVGIKFSGSKGFHIIIPWNSFPKEVNGIKTKDMFPEWPRIITSYITEKINEKLLVEIGKTFYKDSKFQSTKYIKGDKQSGDFAKQVMPDLILVSSRHLFRMPYSLHEKTALASVVLDKDKISEFQLNDANPLKVKIYDFMPDSKEGEASELLMQALDWNRENNKSEKQEQKTNANFKPIKLEKLSDQFFPPCIRKILLGLADGKKRGLFVLINFFRTLGMEKDELEKRIEEWNKKNQPPLRQGYIKSQLIWSFRNKIILPPNCREYYKGLGVCQPDALCNTIKNPVNYAVRKSFALNANNKKKTKKFKNMN